MFSAKCGVQVRVVAGFLFFGISLNSGCSSKAVRNEEYEVYSYLVNSEFRHPEYAPYVVIGDHTVIPPEIPNEAKQVWSLLARSAWVDFTEKNQVSWPLVDRFWTGTRYYLIPLGELRSWNASTAYQRRFPRSGGSLAFSRVGLASRGRFAIVYMDNIDIRMCFHSSFYYLLAKDEKGWRKVTRFAAPPLDLETIQDQETQAMARPGQKRTK